MWYWQWLLIPIAALAGFGFAWWRRGAELRRMVGLLSIKNEELNRLGDAQVNTIREITQEAARLRDKITSADDAERAGAAKDEEIARLRRSLEEVQESLSSGIREKEGLVAELRLRLDELEPLRSRVRELEQVKSRSDERIAEAVAERDRDIALLQRRIHELGQASAAGIETRDAEIERLRTELELLQAQAKEFETIAAQREAELQARILQSEASFEELRQKAVQFEAEAHAVIQHREQELEDMHRRSQSAAPVQELERLIAQRDHRIEELEQEFRDRTSRMLEQQEAAFQKKESEIREVRGALAPVQDAARAAEDRLSAMEREMAGQVAHLEGWIRQLSAELDHQRREQQRLLRQADAARALATEWEAAHGRLAEEHRAALQQGAAAISAGNGQPSPGAPPFDVAQALALAEYEIRALHQQMQHYEQALRDRDGLIARLQGNREPTPRLY